jgi:dsDNA-specific endonuclease/ATPase MutS2
MFKVHGTHSQRYLCTPGKSVYLKMVGLLQYMAQLGSFVPAKDGKTIDRYAR